MVDDSNDMHVEAIRAFNRVYTRTIGVLDEHLLQSEFSLAEARLLYELAHRKDVSAADLARELAIDPGYLSRMLRGFDGRGFIARKASPADARQSLLSLTDAGRAAFAPLDLHSAEAVSAMLAPLSASEQKRLVAATGIIATLIGGKPRSSSYVLRRHQPGDIGWIVHRQGKLYAEEYGWDETYEGLVAEILAGFIKTFDAKRERAWIAEMEGVVVGSVFLMKQSDEIAKLRLLYVEPSARGIGLGARLVDECVAFARGTSYRTLTLWTNDILSSARHIYEKAGFRLTAQGRHKSFGKDLVGQTWELKL